MLLEDTLAAGFAALGVTPDGGAAARYRIYFEHLEKMNAVMNLTAISGEEDVARLHFLDCAALLGMADFRGKRVIDVGTGAGFPGLALKIACPDMELTLLDSLDKRIGFLRDTCAMLGFDDVRCIHARAEEAPEQLRAGFDIACSRAVARLNLLCELCLPLVNVGGSFISMKSVDAGAELDSARRAIEVLGGTVDRVVDYDIPGTEIRHRAIVIKKARETPKKYPRAFAKIKKNPL